MELARWVGASTVHALVCEKLPEAMGNEVNKLLEESAGTAGTARLERFARAEEAKRASMQQAPPPATAAAPSDHPSSHAVAEEAAPMA